MRIKANTIGTATRVGSLGVVIGGDLVDPSKAPLSSVRKIAAMAAASVTRGRRSAEGDDEAEKRFAAIEDTLKSINDKLESMAPVEDDETESEKDDENETTSSEDDENETESVEEDENKPASSAAVKAACKGASDSFVLSCIEQGLTAKQAFGMYTSQQARVPSARGRKPVAASRSGGGAANSVATQIKTLTHENIAKGMSKNDALGTAMNAIKRIDPEGVQSFIAQQQQQHRREQIGAAAAG